MTGTGASAIASVQATDDLYKEAMEVLKQRFGGERIIVQDQLRGLLDLEPMSASSDGRELQQLYNLPQAHI